MEEGGKEEKREEGGDKRDRGEKKKKRGVLNKNRSVCAFGGREETPIDFHNRVFDRTPQAYFCMWLKSIVSIARWS